MPEPLRQPLQKTHLCIWRTRETACHCRKNFALDAGDTRCCFLRCEYILKLIAAILTYVDYLCFRCCRRLSLAHSAKTAEKAGNIKKQKAQAGFDPTEPLRFAGAVSLCHHLWIHMITSASGTYHKLKSSCLYDWNIISYVAPTCQSFAPFFHVLPFSVRKLSDISPEENG